jgi:hypothetical protein
MAAYEARTSKDSLYPLIANAKAKNISNCYCHSTDKNKKSKKKSYSLFSWVIREEASHA